MGDSSTEMSFWDHIDVLRGTIFRSAGAILLFAVLGLCFKNFMFDYLILAPASSDFFLYRWLGVPFEMELINIDISAQFFVHLKTSIALGFILAFPYIIYEVWKFVAPALYENEKKAMRKAFLFSSVLFYLGVVLGYCIIFPITLNFFQGYTVSDTVKNTISLQSYISMFTSMVLLFGVVFEFPTVIAVLSKLGIITRDFLRKYRKYAIVLVLILSAIITPADPFSMFVAAIPLYMLYELSIIFCSKEEEPTEE